MTNRDRIATVLQSGIETRHAIDILESLMTTSYLDGKDAGRKQALADAASVKPNRTQEDKKPATSDLDVGYNMGYIDGVEDMWNALEALQQRG